MICELCHKTKPKGVLIEDIAACDSCICKLVNTGDIDVRDFTNAKRI
jgi:hypothetical protein